jgi:hypothetical protein
MKRATLFSSTIAEIGMTLQEVWLTVQGRLPVRHQGQVIALDRALPAATTLEERRALAQIAFQEMHNNINACSGRAYTALRLIEDAACSVPQGSEQRPSPAAAALGMTALLQIPVTERDVILMRKHTDSLMTAALMSQDMHHPGM